MKKRVFILSILFVLFSLSFISAHQPRNVMGNNLSYYSPALYEIRSPEISQAFYGQLKGEPDHYGIYFDSTSNLYLNILSPYPNGVRDFIVEVLKLNQTGYNLVYVLDGKNFTWTNFFEEFAGDNYWMGPELDVNVSEGIYIIRVSSNLNLDKYSLAVGKIEAFPKDESINALKVVPLLKMRFFDKSIFSIFQGKIFQYIGLGVIFLVLVVWLLIWIIVKLVKNFSKKKNRK